MSNPLLVTDKAPKFIHGIQKDVVPVDDLAVMIGTNEQLELRGSMTVYNDLTINGKLYIIQELGF